jgi:hypothetical protein
MAVITPLLITEQSAITEAAACRHFQFVFADFAAAIAPLRRWRHYFALLPLFRFFDGFTSADDAFQLSLRFTPRRRLRH